MNKELEQAIKTLQVPPSLAAHLIHGMKTEQTVTGHQKEWDRKGMEFECYSIF